MRTGWTVTELLETLEARGEHPAVIEFGQEQARTCSCAELAARATAGAHLLRARGLRAGEVVALWAPNSTEWIVMALASMAAGCVLAPIDDLAGPAQFDAALASSEARLLLTTRQRAEDAAVRANAKGIALLAVDAAADGTDHGTLPRPGEDDPAVLSWTSGTTGTPKAFLMSYRNLSANVTAMAECGVLGPRDRALLPLPIHHAYPFVVGMLTMLEIGAPIVLPASTAGPQLMHAMRAGEVSTIIGVPRLYEAMAAAIDARAAGRGWLVHGLWQGLLHANLAILRLSGLKPGRLLYAPLRRTIAPRLRFLISGGARLDPAIEALMEALGWTVLVGYGLAETCSLFTGSLPWARRLGSAGRPLAGGEVRIAEPDAEGIGEIQLRGPSVIAGYRRNPAADKAGFAPDGWFRTGDLGFVDKDGFLFVTGRIKEALVLGGGKKVNPEDMERIYADLPQIAEIAVMEREGGLVALIRADPAQVREMGTINLREGIRVALAVRGRDLPPYQRLAGFALTDEPFPRTRLGKYQRFLLPPMYDAALGEAARRPARPLREEDRAMLADPVVAAVWDLLQQRYPGQAVDWDVNLALDLNLDSFGWMELSLLLRDRWGVRLSEADIAGCETIRDLLRYCAARPPAAADAVPSLITDTARWLAPAGPGLRLARRLLYGLNWLGMRLLFRLRVAGVEHVPRDGAFVLTPNHGSYLDGLLMAAALPAARLRRMHWAAAASVLFRTRLQRAFSRVFGVYPVDDRRPDVALDMAARLLAEGDATVWFPEGWRTPDGRLQRFLPGIGQLLLRGNVLAVPAYIDGSFAALPRGRRWPRPHRITVTFGPPVAVATLRAEGMGDTDEELVANALRQRVVALMPPSAEA